MNSQADEYLSTLNRLPNTVGTYRWALEMYFLISGDDSLTDLAYEKFWTHPRVKPMSESTKRVIRSAVMGLFRFLNVGDIARREQVNDHYLRHARTNPVMFDIDAVESVIGHCSNLVGRSLLDLRDRAFVLLLADGGFRISELCSLKRGSIDFDKQRVAVVGKGDKPAYIRLSKRSLKAVRDYLRKRMKMDGKSGQALGSLPLFAQHGRIRKVKAITVDGMRKAIKARMEEAGVAHCRIHDFRHYFVTTVLRASNNLKIAQELARHSNIQTTQRYAHLSDMELDKSYGDIFNRR